MACICVQAAVVSDTKTTDAGIPVSTTSKLLLETGGYLLKETDGGKLKLESST